MVTTDHTDFWVVVGTVAPVIGLAHLVALRPAWSMYRAGRTSTATGRRVFLWVVLGPIAFVPLSVAVVGIGLCISSFVGALLWLGRSYPPAQTPHDATVSLTIAFVGVPLQLVLFPVVRWVLLKVGSEPPPEENPY